MHLRISNRSIKTTPTGLLLAHCPQKYIKCWSVTIAIASWAFLIPISVSSTCSSPPSPLLYPMLSTPGGWTSQSLWSVCFHIWKPLPLKATASQAATAYTAASIRTFDLLPWGRKCQEYANAKLSYLCHTHNFCTMGTVNIIAVCLRDCSGNRDTHSPRQVFPSDV